MLFMDLRCPQYAPAPGSATADGINGFTQVLNDDGKSAIEFVAYQYGPPAHPLRRHYHKLPKRLAIRERHRSGAAVTESQWDSEGRMTSLQYPTVIALECFGNLLVTLPTAGYQYDTNGRLAEITMNDNDGNGPQWLAGATYTPAGQIQSLSIGAWTKTRTYAFDTPAWPTSIL